MSILFEYNEALHEKTLRQEGWEDGWEDGRSAGLKEGHSAGLKDGRSAERRALSMKLLQNGLSCEEVSRLTEIPLAEIRALSGTSN